MLNEVDEVYAERQQEAVHVEHVNAFVFGLKLSLAYAWAVFPLALVALFAFIPFAWPLIPPLIVAAVAPAVKLFQNYNKQTSSRKEAEPWNE